MATSRFETVFVPTDVKALTSSLEEVGTAGASSAVKIKTAFGAVESGAAAATGALKGLAAGLIGAFGGITLGRVLTDAIGNAQRFGAEVDQLRDVLGGSAGEAAALNTALKIVGTTAEQYTSTVSQMIANVQRNEEGFRALGLSLRDANGDFVDGQEAVKRATDWLGQYREGVDRTAAAQALAGEGGKRFFDIVDAGGEVMEYARDRAAAWGLAVDASGKLLEDNRIAVGKWRIEVELMSVALGQKLIPVINDLLAFKEPLQLFADQVARSFHTLALLMQGEVTAALKNVANQYASLLNLKEPFTTTPSFRAAQEVGLAPGDLGTVQPPPVSGIAFPGLPKPPKSSSGRRSGGGSGSGPKIDLGTGISAAPPGSFRAAQDLGVPEGIDLGKQLQQQYDAAQKAEDFLDDLRQQQLRAIGDIDGAELISYQKRLRQIEALQLTDEQATEARSLAAQELARNIEAAADKSSAAWDAAASTIGRVFSDLFSALITGTELTAEKILQTVQRTLLSQAFQQLFSYVGGQLGGSPGNPGLLAQLGSFLGFSGGGSGPPSVSAGGTASTSSSSSIVPVSFFHSGGIVGEAAPSRRLPASLFAGAPRLHAGGTLAPGEVPAVLQRGETVLPRGGARMQVTINNYGGAAVNARQTDGGLVVDIDAAVAGVLARPDSLSRRVQRRGGYIVRG